MEQHNRELIAKYARAAGELPEWRIYRMADATLRRAASNIPDTAPQREPEQDRIARHRRGQHLTKAEKADRIDAAGRHRQQQQDGGSVRS